MPIDLTALGMTAASAAIQGGVNYGIQGAQTGKQYKKQRKLNEQQEEISMRLTDYNMQKQMEMWEATGYGAQKEQMKRAGLNPGLMYGMGSGGGGTTNIEQGHGNAGSAAMGGPIDIGNLAKLQAEIENIKANTELTKTEAKKRGGVDTANVEAHTKSLTQGIENQKAVEQLTKIQTRIAEIDEWIKGKSAEDAADLIGWQMQTAKEQAGILKSQGTVDAATVDEKIGIIEREYLQKYLQNELLKSQTTLNNDQRGKIHAEIMQIATNIQKMVVDVKQKNRELDIREVEAEIKQFEATMRANYPGIGQVTGGMVNSIVQKLNKWFGLKQDYTQPNKP